MADHYLIKGETLSDIADAIREKTGNDSPIAAEDMAGEIETIPQGGAEGTIYISQNDTYNVSQYQYAAVQVPQPSGKITITENGTNVNIAQYEIADINVDSLPSQYFLLDQPKESGYMSRMVIHNNWTSLRDYSFYWTQTASSVSSQVEHLILDEPIAGVSYSAFFHFTMLKKIEFLGDCAISNLGGAANIESVICRKNVSSVSTNGNAQIMLYDFSNTEIIPTLSAAGNLGHASGCVIRVPAAKLTEWQNATNWNALTGVVWEGV